MKIDNNHPIPKPSTKGKPTYPFGDMYIGGSFFIHGDSKAISSIRTAASSYGKRHGKQFTVRVEDSGVRCWRTA